MCELWPWRDSPTAQQAAYGVASLRVTSRKRERDRDADRRTQHVVEKGGPLVKEEGGSEV